MPRLPTAVLLILLPLFSHAASPTISFNRDVRPVLATLCFECHGPDEEARKADLRLDTPEGALESAIIPGDPDASPLIQRLLSHDDDERMPPPESPRQPKPGHIETLRRWIAQGAPFENHWSFSPIHQTEPPPVADPTWPRTPLDHFVLHHLDRESLTPQPDAGPTVLARRLSLATTGLPTAPAQLDAFAEDYATAPDAAIDRFVDQLLASAAYGEHLAWTWMDAARYADTNGYQADGPRTMWRWRDWLIGALNTNLPFDRMTEHMLAGDLLLPEHHRTWQSAGWIPDPIKQNEYYQLLSFFDNVPEVGSALKHASHPYIHTPLPTDHPKLTKLKSAADSAAAKLATTLPELAPHQAAWERTLEGSNHPRVTRNLRHRYATRTLHFDGHTTIEKTNKPIKLCAGSKPWTISFWVRPGSTKKATIFSSVEEPERYRPGIQADWVNGKIRLRHVCRWVNSYIEFESTGKLAPHRWHHLTFRCDGRMQGLAYSASLDGDATAMRCTHPVTNDSADNAGKAPLVLGGGPFLPNFRGSLRDLRFYDRDLTPAEITSLADPRPTAEIAAIPTADRTPAEAETLHLAFLESDALPDHARQLRDTSIAARAAFHQALADTPTTMVMQDADLGPTRFHRSGAYDQPVHPVRPGTPAVLPPLPGNSTPDRLTLARWLTHPDHPLTARVATNRIWQLLWGRGLVDSPENFGTQCAQPAHAALLDHLASEFIRSGWDTKALVKTIVSSRTFRQSSTAPEQQWLTDPDNRQLARGPRFRLPVGAVRDQALALSGRLDTTLGGPPVLIDEVKGKGGKPVKLDHALNDRRRTLYTFWKRNAPHPMLAVFDVADRNQCDVREPRTNTPLQALVTLNEPGLAACARDLAQRARDTSPDQADQLTWIWKACTGRSPTPPQLAHLQKTLTNYQESTGSPDTAWTALANVLLNLDATLTLE